MASFVADAVTFNTTAGNKTVAITPAVGDLLVAICANTGTTTDPTVTDDRGGTYTRVGGCAKATSADEMHFYVRDQLCQVAAAHTLTMNVGGAGTGGGIWVSRYSGMAKAGANAVRQVSSAQNNQGAGATPLSSFAQDALDGNAKICAVFNATNPAGVTQPSGYTERRDVGYASPASGLEVATIDTGGANNQFLWQSTSASAFCCIGIELDTATPTFGGSGRSSRPGQPHETRRRRLPFPAQSLAEGPVTETPTFGGAVAGGVSPTAQAGVTAAGATAGGQTPAPRAVLTAQGATAGGNTTSSTSPAPQGGATAQGTAPGPNAPVTPGGATGGGVTQNAASTSFAAGGALAGGNTTSSSSPATTGGATAGGGSPGPAAGVPPGGGSSGSPESGESASDDFNRTDADPLDGDWTLFPGSTGVAKLAGNLVVIDSPTEDGDKFYSRTDITPELAQWAECRVSQLDTDGGPACRIGGGTGFSGYFFSAFVGATGKFENGSFSEIGADVSAFVTDGCLVRMEVYDVLGVPVIDIYIDGVLRDSFADGGAYIGTGVGPGFFLFSSQDAADGIDDWQGGNLEGVGIQAVVDVTAGGATAGGNAPTEQTDDGESETPTPGGALAGGNSPAPTAAVDSGASTGQGTPPTSSTTVSSGGATAGGNSPTAVVGVTPGGATAGGNEPTYSQAETPTPGGATAQGNAPGALAVSAAGGATTGGTSPTPTATATPGGATTGGNAPAESQSETATTGGATAGGFASSSAASVDQGGASTGPGEITAVIFVDFGGATAGGNAPSAPLSEVPDFGGATAGGLSPSPAAAAALGGAVADFGAPTTATTVSPGAALAGGNAPTEIGVTPPAPVGPTPGSGVMRPLRHLPAPDRPDRAKRAPIEEEEEALILLGLSLE